eukprot:6793962-Pyramimonas_sp.AAC.1
MPELREKFCVLEAVLGVGVLPDEVLAPAVHHGLAIAADLVRAISVQQLEQLKGVPRVQHPELVGQAADLAQHDEGLGAKAMRPEPWSYDVPPPCFQHRTRQDHEELVLENEPGRCDHRKNLVVNVVVKASCSGELAVLHLVGVLDASGLHVPPLDLHERHQHHPDQDQPRWRAAMVQPLGAVPSVDRVLLPALLLLVLSAAAAASARGRCLDATRLLLDIPQA